MGLGVGEQGTWDGGLEIQGNGVLIYLFSVLKGLGTHFIPNFSTKSAKGKPVSYFCKVTSTVLSESQRNFPFFFF